MNEIEQYCQSDMDFIFPRLSNETKRIFLYICNSYFHTKEGVNWKTLVEQEKDRFKVERSLFLLTTLGFVSYEQILNQRHKRYIPHLTRGKQLAAYIEKEQKEKMNQK